jgi:hypothetical protein
MILTLQTGVKDDEREEIDVGNILELFQLLHFHRLKRKTVELPPA